MQNEFLQTIKERLQEFGDKREITGTRDARAHAAEEIIQRVMDEFSIGRDEIFNRKRGNFFRNMTLSLLKQFTPMSLKEIGELFQMDYAAVSQACKRYEEKVRNRGKDLPDRKTKN